MSFFKRAAAFLTAAGFAVGMTACGSNTTQALNVDGMDVPAGIYIYFANTCYNNALSQLATEQPDLDTTDLKAVKAAILEGKDVRTWVQDKATEMCVDFVKTEQKFDELNLELTADDEYYIDMMMSYYWDADIMERNGISETSFRRVVASSYKSDAIFDYYYGVGGENGVTEDELYEYYVENNIRCHYIRINMTDGEGNLLKSDGKAELLKIVEGYRDRVEDALEEGGIPAVMTEMSYVQEDYNYYVTSISEEAAGVEEPATTTPRTTETTAAAEEDTDEADETAAAGEEDNEAEETEAEETEAEETEEASDEDEAEAADLDEEAVDEEEDTTEAEETEEAEETTGPEETEAEEEATTEAPEESGEEETVAASDEDGTGEETDTETVTEAVSYDAESIISVIDLSDYEDEDDIYYTPSEKTYNKLLEIKPEDYGRPYIVEEDEQYYLVVRYDIEERMTEDDLWSESAVNSTAYAKYGDDFEDMLDDWSAAAAVTRNNAAYNRYDPYKFDFS